MSKPQSTPRSVVVFTAFLAGIGVAAAQVDHMLHGWRPVEWPWLLPLMALLVAGGYIQIRFRYRDEIEALDLFEAVLAPVLFAYAGWVVVAAVLVANVAEALLHRNQAIKAAFNVAQWMAAAGSGALLFATFRQGQQLSWHNVGALVAALAVMLVVNHLAFSVVVALAQGQSLRQVVAGLRTLIVPVWLIGGGVNLAFGLLFVAAYQWNAAAVPLFFVPLLALNWSSKAYAAARADEARLRALHQASTLLLEPVDPFAAMEAFLDEVRTSFEAEAAELVLVGNAGVTVYRSTEGATAHEPWPLATLLSLDEPSRLTTGPIVATQVDRWRDCLAAPLLDSGKAIGVLCTYNRTGLEGFEDGELAVLGALAGVVVTAIQKGRLVQEVVDEQQKLGEIVNNTSDGIFTLAADGTVASWNPAFETLTGWPAAEVVGTRHVANLRPHDDDGRDVLIERWTDETVALPDEVQVLTRDGVARWLSCSYTRVADTDGTPRSLVVVARDVTKARELEHLKEDFVATVSHELRTPLAPIKGWATTLLTHGERLGEDQRREATESILRHASRLEGLIVNLLEASKIEHGRVVDVDDEIDVAPVVNRVIDGFQASWPGRLFVISGVERASLVRGNELWIEQILSNLVSNAIKYSPATAPVELAVTGGAGGIEIAVTDQGPGIPAEDLEAIFGRFHRLPQTDTQTGTGLGLYIARQLAAEIGSTISVTSTPGQGSRFTLRLRGTAGLAAVS